MVGNEVQACVFCQSPTLTAEDILPRWMSRLLMTDVSLAQLQRGSSYTKVVVENDVLREHLGPERLVSHIVCDKCNNGWMSSIEARTRPIIARLAGNVPTLLLPQQMETLTAWACLKALTTGFLRDKWAPPPQDWLREFYVTQMPPRGRVVVWLGQIHLNARAPKRRMHIVDRRVVQLRGTGLGLGSLQGMRFLVTGGSGIVLTMTVAHLAIQVVWQPTEWTPSPDPPGLIRIWPNSGVALLWPPKMMMSLGDVATLSDRWTGRRARAIPVGR